MNKLIDQFWLTVFFFWCFSTAVHLFVFAEGAILPALIGAVLWFIGFKSR